MLGWSASDLAAKRDVGPATVRRYEMQDGIPSANTRVLAKLRSALERAGIEFTGDPLINPGVTLKLSNGAQPD